MNSEARRVGIYLRLIDGGQRCRLHPPAKGLEVYGFEYVDFTESHLKIRNIGSGVEYYIPFELIEFINPAGGGAIISLKRELIARWDSLL